MKNIFSSNDFMFIASKRMQRFYDDVPNIPGHATKSQKAFMVALFTIEENIDALQSILIADQKKRKKELGE